MILHYTTLCYIILHYTTLYYITLHYTILCYIKLHYNTLQYTILHYAALRCITLYYGAKGDWDFWISDLVKNLMELIFNLWPCGEFQWSPEEPVSQIHPSPHVVLLGSLQIFKVCSDAKAGDDSFSRCDVCEGRAPNSFRVTSGESVVMQGCLRKRCCDCGRLL